MRKYLLKPILFLSLTQFFMLPAIACNYSAMMRSYHRAVAQWQADPTPARAERICRIIARIDNKFTNTPPNFTPTPPPGITCDPRPQYGNGRGGGPGGVVIGIGTAATPYGWVRNLGPDPCIYDWEIVPDPANPAGFDVTVLTGSVLVPANTSEAVPFEVIIDPLVPPGTVGFFDIFWTHSCTGLPLPPESSHFQIFADPELTILPSAPFLLIEPGLPLPVMFDVTNHTASPVSRTLDFVHVGDPGSLMAFNDGTPFDAINLFPTDKSVTSIDFTVPALSTQIILKDTLLAGEICDPAMINCCGLKFGDDGLCCINVFNDDLFPRNITHIFQELQGAPTGVGSIGYQYGPFLIQIPTNAAPSVPELIDLLGQQTLFQALTLNGFNVFPMVDENGFLLMAPLQPFPLDFFSNDPGLQWQPILPPVGPLFPQFPLPPAPGGLDLMTQALVPTVNGWLPPPGD